MSDWETGLNRHRRTHLPESTDNRMSLADELGIDLRRYAEMLEADRAEYGNTPWYSALESGTTALPKCCRRGCENTVPDYRSKFCGAACRERFWAGTLKQRQKNASLKADRVERTSPDLSSGHDFWATSEHTPLAHRVNDACELIGVSMGTMFQLMKEGEIESFRIGRHRLIAHETLVAFIEKARAASRQAVEEARM